MRVVGAQAIAPRRVRISFDAPVRQRGDGAPGDALQPERYQFEALTAPAVSVTAVGVEPAGPEAVEVVLDLALSQRAHYCVTAAGVVGEDGTALAPGGDRATFAGFMPPGWPRERAFELLRMLPTLNRQMDQTGDLGRLMGVFQDVLELLLTEIDRFSDLLDPDRAPEPFLSQMLEDLGNPFQFDLDTLQKRRLLSVLVQIYRQKGTAAGIRNAIRFFLGVDVTSIAAFHGTTLVLGEAELGVDWVLGPSDAFARYAFDLTVSRRLTDAERRMIRAIVSWMKPAHTRCIEIHEPGAPAFVHHWELGVSRLGDNTELH